jgi:hypothetical protein
MLVTPELTFLEFLAQILTDSEKNGSNHAEIQLPVKVAGENKLLRMMIEIRPDDSPNERMH